MITFYIPGEPALELAVPAQCPEFTRRAVWIDLCEPTPEEEQLLEAALGLDMPTREEMQAIELSSRLYKEGIIPRVASSTKLTLPAQNRIVKIVSIAAVVFLPPTLVASIYGMNFELMPELRWAAGYPFAIVLMVISAVLPYVWFKRKGWL